MNFERTASYIRQTKKSRRKTWSNTVKFNSFQYDYLNFIMYSIATVEKVATCNSNTVAAGL